jgi:hypothetical protein
VVEIVVEIAAVQIAAVQIAVDLQTAHHVPEHAEEVHQEEDHAMAVIQTVRVLQAGQVPAEEDHLQVAEVVVHHPAVVEATVAEEVILHPIVVVEIHHPAVVEVLPEVEDLLQVAEDLQVVRQVLLLHE